MLPNNKSVFLWYGLIRSHSKKNRRSFEMHHKYLLFPSPISSLRGTNYFLTGYLKNSIGTKWLLWYRINSSDISYFKSSSDAWEIFWYFLRIDWLGNWDLFLLGFFWAEAVQNQLHSPCLAEFYAFSPFCLYFFHWANFICFLLHNFCALFKNNGLGSKLPL